MKCSTASLIFMALACLAFASTQAVIPTSDPQALSLATQSMAALTQGTLISDATLSGRVSWIVGPDTGTGTPTLYAKGTGESRIDLNLSTGMRTEIRNDTAGYPQGATVINGGSQQTWALHNCWVDASWFFPPLSFLSATSDPTLIFTYLGQESRNGATVQHLRVYRYLAGQSANAISLIRQVSTMDIYLDAASLLPVAFTFNTHPDDDASTNIVVEIDFSSYLLVNGVNVPTHIQKFVSGTLTLDIRVSSAVFNSGLSDTLFAIQ